MSDNYVDKHRSLQLREWFRQGAELQAKLKFFTMEELKEIREKGF